ncbi:MAG TPA: ribonuclease III [Nitrospirales bacterium]|nr:ribonuclease III [Nitrospirales bacterium]
MTDDLARAQRVLGYTFKQPRLLDEALTHKSHVNEARHKDRKHNERLEFLGDAVLTLIVSEQLATANPEFTEGELSKAKARVVSEPTLAQAARRMSLGSLLRLGRGEEMTQGREKPSLLANALEALLAAIYLDGGLDAARHFVVKTFAAELAAGQSANGGVEPMDYKTELQEWCQKRFDTLPQYVTVRESGPDHQKTFEVQLVIAGDIRGVGIGRSKKEAEQMAAKQALKYATLNAER